MKCVKNGTNNTIQYKTIQHNTTTSFISNIEQKVRLQEQFDLQLGWLERGWTEEKYYRGPLPTLDDDGDDDTDWYDYDYVIYNNFSKLN